MMQMHYFYEISRLVASIHRDAEKGSSRKPGFRQKLFSEPSKYREEGRNGCAQVLFHLSLSSPKPDVTSL